MNEFGSLNVLASLNGGYFSDIKLVVTLLLVLPWAYASGWIYRDTVRVHTPQALWSGVAMGSGALGVVLWLLMPYYVLGMAFYLALTGGVIGGYIAHRNKRVVASARVLTGEHIKLLMARKHGPRGPVEVVQKLKLYDSIRRPVFAPATDSDEHRRAYNLAQNFLHNVVLFRASEVDLTPMGAQTAVRFVIDGVVQNRPPADRADADVVVDYIKALAGMNLEDRRRPQTGKIGVEAGAVAVDVTVTTAGTSHGQRMQLKIVQEAARTKLENLGMPGEMLARVEVLNGRPGLLLVSGAARNGVTSTLYSLLRQHDSFTQQLATMEVTPAVELENVTQTTYKDQVELPSKLGSALRRDPNVIMVDACETAQAAGILLEAAAERNILLGMRADSAFVALAKWIKVAGGAEKAVAALKGVTCQVLLRKLCPACKEAFRPAKEMLVKLNLPAEKIDKFYRPPTKPQVDDKGNPIICPTCRGTGYMGRTAAFELLEFNDEIRQLVIQNAPLAQLKAACRKSRMLYLQEQALRKVIEGLTNIEEVIRVSKAK